jgi:hypothetical protein
MGHGEEHKGHVRRTTYKPSPHLSARGRTTQHTTAESLRMTTPTSTGLSQSQQLTKQTCFMQPYMLHGFLEVITGNDGRGRPRRQPTELFLQQQHFSLINWRQGGA